MKIHLYLRYDRIEPSEQRIEIEIESYQVPERTAEHAYEILDFAYKGVDLDLGNEILADDLTRRHSCHRSVRRRCEYQPYQYIVNIESAHVAQKFFKINVPECFLQNGIKIIRLEVLEMYQRAAFFIAYFEICLAVDDIKRERRIPVLLHRNPEHEFDTLSFCKVRLKLYARGTVFRGQQRVEIERGAAHCLEIAFYLVHRRKRIDIRRSLLVFGNALVLAPLRIKRDVLCRDIRELHLRTRKSRIRIPALEYETVSVCTRRSFDDIRQDLFDFATSVSLISNVEKLRPFCIKHYVRRQRERICRRNRIVGIEIPALETVPFSDGSVGSFFDRQYVSDLCLRSVAVDES